jgi:hypothetical protein
MIDSDKKIRKGLGPRRAVESYQTQRDITIPAGTLLRGVGDTEFAASVGLSPGCAGTLTVTIKPGQVIPADALKRVVA